MQWMGEQTQGQSQVEQSEGSPTEFIGVTLCVPWERTRIRNNLHIVEENTTFSNAQLEWSWMHATVTDGSFTPPMLVWTPQQVLPGSSAKRPEETAAAGVQRTTKDGEKGLTCGPQSLQGTKKRREACLQVSGLYKIYNGLNMDLKQCSRMQQFHSLCKNMVFKKYKLKEG